MPDDVVRPEFPENAVDAPLEACIPLFLDDLAKIFGAVFGKKLADDLITTALISFLPLFEAPRHAWREQIETLGPPALSKLPMAQSLHEIEEFAQHGTVDVRRSNSQGVSVIYPLIDEIDSLLKNMPKDRAQNLRNVILMANGRRRLKTGPIDAKSLAILGGVTTEHIRNLLALTKKGKVPEGRQLARARKSTSITKPSALAWLQSNPKWEPTQD